MILTATTTDELLRAFDKVRDGDTIEILNNDAGSFVVVPKTPDAQNMPAAGGAPLILDGHQDVTVRGLGWPTIQSTGHGSILVRRNCQNCHASGLRFKGAGYILKSGPPVLYFAPVLYIRSPYCDTTGCIVEDSGDQGIAELHFDGPEGSDHCRITGNQIRRCGTLVNAGPNNSPDGAGIAFGNSYCLITNNVIEDCLRGIEIETNNAGHATAGNVIAHNVILRSLWQGIVSFVTHGQADLFADNVIGWNHIVGRGAPHPAYPQWGQNEHGITLTGGRRWQVVGNTIGNLNDWCGIEALAAMADLSDCLFRDNVSVNCGRGGIWNVAQNGKTNSGHYFDGNRAIGCKGAGIWTDGSNMTIGNNFFQNPIGTQPNGQPWEAVHYQQQ